jgi:hypothetical protein
MFGFLWNLYPAIGSGMRASISVMMASTSSIELGFSATGSSGNLVPVLRAWNRSSAAWRAVVVIGFLLAILNQSARSVSFQGAARRSSTLKSSVKATPMRPSRMMITNSLSVAKALP